MRITTGNCSRAMLHSVWMVYWALPSDCRQNTRLPRSARAAPKPTGIPWPMAPPVLVITRCRAALAEAVKNG